MDEVISLIRGPLELYTAVAHDDAYLDPVLLDDFVCLVQD